MSWSGNVGSFWHESPIVSNSSLFNFTCRLLSSISILRLFVMLICCIDNILTRNSTALAARWRPPLTAKRGFLWAKREENYGINLIIYSWWCLFIVDMYLFQYHFLQKVLTDDWFLADAYTPANFFEGVCRKWKTRWRGVHVFLASRNEVKSTHLVALIVRNLMSFQSLCPRLK